VLLKFYRMYAIVDGGLPEPQTSFGSHALTN
jgi:hypothetical protein